MSKFNRQLRNDFGFLAETVTEGNDRAVAYFGKGTIFTSPEMNVVVLAPSNADLERFLEKWCEMTGQEEKPIVGGHVYPLALMHQDYLRIEDDEL